MSDETPVTPTPEVPVTPPARSVTMKDVALRCGLSTYAVSRVLNKKPGINARTAETVIAAAAELGYDPAMNIMARRLVQRRYGTQELNNTVGLFFPENFYRVAYFIELFQGLMDVFTEAGFSILSTTERNLTSPAVANAALVLPANYARGEIDGVVMLGSPTGLLPTINQLRAESGFGQRPIISLMRPVPGSQQVTARDRDAGYLVARHLLTLGHRHLAHLQYGTSTYEIDEREIGYRQACVEFGIDPETHLHPLRLTVGIMPEENTADIIERSLPQYPQVTALIALNDLTAITAYYTLKRMGICVPDDMSLVGFDNSEALLDEHGENILTSVDLSLTEIGRSAARSMVQQLLRKVESTPETLPTPQLVIRRSTIALHAGK